jgi:hypothetical protein
VRKTVEQEPMTGIIDGTTQIRSEKDTSTHPAGRAATTAGGSTSVPDGQ